MGRAAIGEQEKRVDRDSGRSQRDPQATEGPVWKSRVGLVWGQLTVRGTDQPRAAGPGIEARGQVEAIFMLIWGPLAKEGLGEDQVRAVKGVRGREHVGGVFSE